MVLEALAGERMLARAQHGRAQTHAISLAGPESQPIPTRDGALTSHCPMASAAAQGLQTAAIEVVFKSKVNELNSAEKPCKAYR